MNISKLRKVIKYLPKKKSILLEGMPGVGKTQWVKQLAKELGLKLVIWMTSHASDACDITGLPRIKQVVITWTKDGVEHREEHEVTTMIPPVWMVQKEPVLLFLDEINRGLVLALNAIMQLTNDQTYDNISLPEGSRLIAAMNPDQNGLYSVTSLDPAQISRFAVYKFLPTKDEWIEWAQNNGIDQTVIAFINSTGYRYLDPFSTAEETGTIHGRPKDKLPDRRGWECVSDTIKNGEADIQLDEATGQAINAWSGPEGEDDLLQTIAGIVGLDAASAYMAFRTKLQQFAPDMILNKPKIDEDLLSTIAGLDTNSAMGVVNNCISYMEDNLIKYKTNSTYRVQWSENLFTMIQALSPEVKSAVGITICYAAVQQKKPWAQVFFNVDQKYKDFIRSIKTIKENYSVPKPATPKDY